MLSRRAPMSAPPSQFEKMRANRVSVAENRRRAMLAEAERKMREIQRDAWVRFAGSRDYSAASEWGQ